MSEHNEVQASRLIRGRFGDGRHEYTVRATGAVAPNSFQVYADGDAADIVLVVSGLNAGNLRATWGDDWRPSDEAWKVWFKEQAFLVFYNGPTRSVGRARVCDG